MNVRPIYFMNPFLGLVKRAQLEREMTILSNEINHGDDIDVLAEIEKDENNPNYQKEDDEMLVCLEETDPLD